MFELVDRKIRQMHDALGNLEKHDLTGIKPISGSTPIGYYNGFDFSQGKSDVEVANAATLVIANIACIKDHLKAWCKLYKKKFEGDTLIDTDMNVAIIHDLWNIDKHADLSRKTRSGVIPKIEELRQSLRLSAGKQAGGSISIMMDPQSGQMKTQSQGAGSASLVISGNVIDENGNVLGDFSEICEKAISSWEKTLIKAGVRIPSSEALT